MNIVYYYNNEERVAPVKQFLKKYDITSPNSPKIIRRKVKILAFIDQSIRFISEHKGTPIAPIAKTIRGHKFHELRIKEGNTLIRILYFTYNKEKLILLNTFEKPERYHKATKKKVEKKVEKILLQTNKYYHDFIHNPQNYEAYK